MGRLGSSVNALRRELSTVLRMYFAHLKDRLDLVKEQIQMKELTTGQIRGKAQSIEREIDYLHRCRGGAEKAIAEFAKFDLPLERIRETETANHLRRLGYTNEFLTWENPRAMHTIKTMAAHGRIGFSIRNRGDNMGRAKILFLAANPTQTTRLDLEEELRAIEIELRGTKYRDHIAFVAGHAVRPDDLVRLVRAEEPNIIHFSGHGATDGILLRGERDGYHIVRGSALARLLIGRGVQIVVLNSCFSMEQANALSSTVHTVVGTTKEVGDEAARHFSVAFYRTLGDGHTIAAAVRDGGDALIVYGLENVYKVIGNTDSTPLGPGMHLR